MILTNVSFAGPFLRAAASFARRLLNPKVAASPTSFPFILGTWEGVKCPLDFFLMEHEELIGGHLHRFKKIFPEGARTCVGGSCGGSNCFMIPPAGAF